MTKTQIMVATPTKFYGPRIPAFDKFISDMREHSLDPDKPYEFVLALCDMGVVPARNKLVANFRQSDCKWLAWLDYDMEPQEGENLLDHLLHLLSKKLPIISGLYTTREENCHWVCNFLYEAQPQKGTVVQVIESGVGAFKLYHREVFDQIEQQFPQISYTDRATGEKLSAFFQHCVVTHDLQAAGDLLPEDFFLDFLCRQCRISVWVDTSVRLKHRGPDGKLYPTGDWPPIPNLETP